MATFVPDLEFTYVQAIPAKTWDVLHNLGKFPSVTVTDSNDDEVEGDIQYVSLNRVRLSFSGAFSGKAIFN